MIDTRDLGGHVLGHLPYADPYSEPFHARAMTELWDPSAVGLKRTSDSIFIPNLLQEFNFSLLLPRLHQHGRFYSSPSRQTEPNLA